MGHKLLTTKEAAMEMRMKPGTLEVWRVYGTGPKFLKVGRLVRYRQADLESFMQSSVKQSTSE
jgi:hypothetical protein